MSEVLETRHKYEYAVDPGADTAPARVVRMVGKGRKVLEIGSGPGSITRVLHELSRCRITAIEIDPEALKRVAPFCERALSADLNDRAWPSALAGERFECVIAADVLEHLYHPLEALAAMKSLLLPDGSIVISLPHVGHAALVACLLNEDFEYRDWGLLDRTHIRFFGIRNMQALFDDAGLKIVAAEFVVRHPEATEFARQWSTLSAEAQRVALGNPFGLVYQAVIRAVPVQAPGAALTLTDLSALARGDLAETPVAGSAGGVRGGGLRGLARRHLSDDVRRALRRVATRLGAKA